MLPFQQLNIDGKVSGCSGQRPVAKQFLDGSQIAAVREQMGGEAGTKQVRVMAGPGLPFSGLADLVIATCDAYGAPGVPVNNLPYSMPAGEPFPMLGDKQADSFTWPRCAPESYPGPQQLVQLEGERQISIDAALAGSDEQRGIVEDVADFKIHDLRCADPGFIDQAQYDVIAEANERIQSRLSENLRHILYGENPGQPDGGSVASWELLRDIGINVAPAAQVAVPGPDSSQLLVKCRNAHSFAAFTHKAIYQVPLA